MSINRFGVPTTKKSEAVADFAKHSGWTKIGRFYLISWETSDPVYEYGEDKHGKFVAITVKCTAITTDGRRISMHGSCSTRDPFISKKGAGEKIPQIENIVMKAETKAISRAVSRIVGSGEVSAEEILEEQENKKFTSGNTSSKSRKPPISEKHDKGVEPTLGEVVSYPKNPANQGDVKNLLKALDRAIPMGLSTEVCKKWIDRLTNNPTVSDAHAAGIFLEQNWPEALEMLT